MKTLEDYRRKGNEVKYEIRSRHSTLLEEEWEEEWRRRSGCVIVVVEEEEGEGDD